MEKMPGEYNRLISCLHVDRYQANKTDINYEFMLYLIIRHAHG